MIQKLEKVLDLAIVALEKYLGQQSLPVNAPVPEKPATRARKPKTSSVETGGLAADVSEQSKISVEETMEAARKGQEVMGLFIRRFLKASPTGLERAKSTINATLGAPRNGEKTWKLEHFSAQDWLKLTPIFEAELDKAEKEVAA